MFDLFEVLPQVSPAHQTVKQDWTVSPSFY